MSYILDALRKSDQLRRRGAAPTLLLAPASTAAAKRPAVLAYGLLALVLLGSGIAIGWLHPWQPEPAAPAAVALNPPEPVASPVPPVAVAPAPQQEAPAPSAAAQPASAPAAIPVPASASAPARSTAGAAIGTHKVPPPAIADAPKKTAAALPTVMTVAELPVAIQQELPPLSISVHAYSAKVAERLVGINNRLLHEGDEVAPGLKLEGITPEGMVLSYKGYTFRRGVH